MNKHPMWVVAAVALTLVAVAGPASGHDTASPPARTAKQCEKLSDVSLRKECVACVSQPGSKHYHYHPDQDAGSRCHADGT